MANLYNRFANKSILTQKETEPNFAHSMASFEGRRRKGNSWLWGIFNNPAVKDSSKTLIRVNDVLKTFYLS